MRPGENLASHTEQGSLGKFLFLFSFLWFVWFLFLFSLAQEFFHSLSSQSCPGISKISLPFPEQFSSPPDIRNNCCTLGGSQRPWKSLIGPKSCLLPLLPRSQRSCVSYSPGARRQLTSGRRRWTGYSLVSQAGNAGRGDGACEGGKAWELSTYGDHSA